MVSNEQQSNLERGQEEVSRESLQRAGQVSLGVIAREEGAIDKSAPELLVDNDSEVSGDRMESLNEQRAEIEKRGEELDKTYAELVEQRGADFADACVNAYLYSGLCKLPASAMGPGALPADRRKMQEGVHELSQQDSQAIQREAMKKLLFGQPSLDVYEYNMFAKGWSPRKVLPLESLEVREGLTLDKMHELGIDPENQEVRREAYRKLESTCNIKMEQDGRRLSGFAGCQAEWLYDTFKIGEHLDEVGDSVREGSAVESFMLFQSEYRDYVAQEKGQPISRKYVSERCKEAIKEASERHDYRGKRDMIRKLEHGQAWENQDWSRIENTAVMEQSIRGYVAGITSPKDSFYTGLHNIFGNKNFEKIDKDGLATCGIDVDNKKIKDQMRVVLYQTMQKKASGWQAQADWVARNFDLEDRKNEIEQQEAELAEQRRQKQEQEAREAQIRIENRKAAEEMDHNMRTERFAGDKEYQARLDEIAKKVPADIYKKALDDRGLRRLVWGNRSNIEELLREGLGRDEIMAVTRDMLSVMLNKGVDRTDDGNEPFLRHDSSREIAENLLDFGDDKTRQLSYPGFANVIRMVNGEKGEVAQWYFEKLGYGENMGEFLGAMQATKEDMDISKQRGFQTKLNRFLRNHDEYKEYLEQQKANRQAQEKVDYGRLGKISAIGADDFHAGIADLLAKAQNDGDYFPYASVVERAGEEGYEKEARRRNQVSGYGLMKVAHLDKLGKFLETGVDPGTKYFREDFNLDGTGTGGKSAYFAVQFDANGKSYLLAESLKDDAAMYFASGEEGEDLREVFRSGSRMEARKAKNVGYIMHLDKEHADSSIQDAFMQAFFHMFVDGKKTAWSKQRNDEAAQMIPAFEQMDDLRTPESESSRGDE